MNPHSLTAIISPAPALILIYSDEKRKKRKRLIPIRDGDFIKDTSADHLEKVLCDLVHRHIPLSFVDRIELKKCLKVLQLVITGYEINEAIRKVSSEFEEKAKKRIKRVSFKEGPHEVQEIREDEVDGINEIVNCHLSLPDDDDEEEQVVNKGMENEEGGNFQIETNFSWNDEDGDFVF